MFEGRAIPLSDEELPVRVGIAPLWKCASEPVSRPVRAVGWDVLAVDPGDLVQGVYSDLDVMVICAGRVTEDLLSLVTRAALNPRLFTLVICEDRDPQSTADILRAGASDYLTYPFADEELIARLRTLAMRSSFRAERCNDAPLVLDYPSRTMFAGVQQVTLSLREWDVLIALLEADAALVTVADLSERLTNAPDNETIVASSVSRLRRKLRAAQFYAISVETVHGHGYLARFRRSGDTFARVEKHR